MTLDEAYTEAVSGAHMTAAHMQPGVCLTYDFKGFRRTWPNGDGCDFIARADDEAADWYEYEAPKVEPLKGGWGSFKPATSNTPEYIAAVDKLIGAPPPKYVIPAKRAALPVEDVIELPGVEHTQHARWFAPCKAISGCGRIMLQAYAEPLAAIALPAEVPAFFTDLKPSNWGRIGNQPVACDYGRTMLMSRGLTKAMKKADWT